jgi:tetratricopeptide (TPR) repeat protein
LIAGDAMAFYLRKLFAPYPLAIDYGRTPALLMRQTWVRLAWIVPVALLILAWIYRRRWPVVAAGVAIFLIGALPNSGLAQFDYQYVSNTADRYAYLALVGAAVVFAAMIERLRRSGAAVALCVMAVCVALTEAQIRTWRNGEALFEHAIAVNPQSWMSRGDLGTILATRDPPRAMAMFRTSIELNPQNLPARVGLAAMLVDRDPDQAIAHCQYILSQVPTMAEAWGNLGCAYRRRGDRSEALNAFARAYQLSPDNLVIAEDYAMELGDAGRIDEAQQIYQRIAPRDPDTARDGLRQIEKRQRAQQH